MAARLRLTVTGGPDKGLVFVLGERDRAVVGRTTECRVPLQDTRLSRRHFEVSWDGATARMLDLGSTNGTRVNGQLVRDTSLRPGDEIEAGDTLLRIEVLQEPEPQPFGPPPSDPPRPSTQARAPGEAAPPVAAERGAAEAKATRPSAAAVPDPSEARGAPGVAPLEIYGEVEPSSIRPQVPEPPPGSLLARLAEATGSKSGARVHALVDGSLAIELALRGRSLGHRLYTLFEGEMAERVAHAGPILIPLDDSSLPFLVEWVKAIGTTPGLLVETPAPLEGLYGHLCGVFRGEDEEGTPTFFRFYDPRVLRAHLLSSTPDHRRAFFGPITAFLVEDEKGEGLERLFLEAAGGEAAPVGSRPV